MSSLLATLAASLAVVWSSFGAPNSAQAQRLLEAELTLESAVLESTAWQRLDDERPPRPIRPPTPTSAGYASGRWPLMIGLSLLAAGTVLAAVLTTTTCYYSSERYTGADVPSAISIGLGVSLTLAGAIRLARLPGPRRRPRLAGALFGTVLMSALTFGLLALTQGEWIGCISS